MKPTPLPAVASSRRQPPPGAANPRPPSDSMWRTALMGWIVIVVFFGVLGAWALHAPLNGAVVAPGLIKVESNRKSVQHLDGGIVREIRVGEGDKVQVGDVLIVLDDGQARTEFEVYSQQYLVLRATEERLKAELTQAPALTMPADIHARGDAATVAGVWQGQVRQFESRAASLEGQRRVIREKIAQLQHQIAGTDAQLAAYRAQLASVRRELDSYKPLIARGLITLARYAQVERAGQALEGQSADAAAAIARARQAIAEQAQQIAQLDNERMTEVTRDLRETQARLLEIAPKLVNAQAVLSRIEVRSPYAGRVVGLSVFSVGGVIAKGEKILEVVPEQDALVIEAQVAVEDISDVRPNTRAEIHFTAYKQRITPTVGGQVVRVSADRLTDPKSGQPYYLAIVRADQSQLTQLSNVHLYPGMPATVMIPTEERTALQYIVGPVLASLNQAFRQR